MFRQAKMREFDVISRIGQTPVVDLDTFKHVFQEAENGTSLSIQFTDIQDSVFSFVEELTVDKTWFPFTYAKRNDSTGKWDTTEILDTSHETLGLAGASPTRATSLSSNLADAIVVVRFHSPLYTGDIGNPPTSGDSLVAHRQSEGIGIVVNAALGLVLCAKSIVRSALGDITVTFNTAFKTKAIVLFASPTLAFSIIQYDPSAVANDAVASVAEIRLSSEAVSPGESLSFVGIAPDYSKELGQGRVKRVEFKGNSPPYNFHCAVMAGENGAGAFIDEASGKAKVVAMSARNSLLAGSIQPYLAKIEAALSTNMAPPQRYAVIGIHLSMTTLAKARAVLGLSDQWATKLVKASKHGRNHLLTVSRRMVGTDAYEKFENNDVILSVDGAPICDLDAYENAVETAAGKPGKVLDITVLREEKVVQLKQVKTTEFATVGTDKVLSFAGMVLHAPHPEIYYLTDPEKIQDGGVYVAELKKGSPSLASENADEHPQHKRGKIIYEVNSRRVNSLEEFIEAVAKVKDSQYCSVTTNNYNTGESKIFNIRLDLEYWPTMLYYRDNQRWLLKKIQHNT